MYVARTLAALALCATALAGCSDDDPKGNTSGDPATEATTTGDPTDTTDPTETAEPTDEAADGELVTGSTFAFHLPEGWTVRDGMTDAWICGPTDNSGELQMTVSWLDIQPYPDLATMAQKAKSSHADANQATRILPETSFAGQPAYHLEGDSHFGHLDEFGIDYQGGTLKVKFELDRSAEEREGLINSVSAGWQWS